MSETPRMSAASSLPIGGERNEAILYEGCKLKRELAATKAALSAAEQRAEAMGSVLRVIAEYGCDEAEQFDGPCASSIVRIAQAALASSAGNSTEHGR